MSRRTPSFSSATSSPRSRFPLSGSTLLPEAVYEEGPALLIDGDCAICKRRVAAFNFAPVLALEDAMPEEGGGRAMVRRGSVRRLFPLEAHNALSDLEWVVDLQRLFSVPRELFPHDEVEIEEREWRVQPHAYGPYNERILRLDLESRQRLRLHIAAFFELNSTA